MHSDEKKDSIEEKNSAHLSENLDEGWQIEQTTIEIRTVGIKASIYCLCKPIIENSMGYAVEIRYYDEVVTKGSMTELIRELLTSCIVNQIEFRLKIRGKWFHVNPDNVLFLPLVGVCSFKVYDL